MFASLPDLLRLLAVPVFGYAAYRDIRTRRVPNQWWYPLAGLGIVLLAWEAFSLFTGPSLPIVRRRFILQVGISLGFVVPLAYGFWLMGGFGGADAKAFFVVALLFPTYPVYRLWEFGIEGVFAQLPIVQTTIGVFSLTVLTNAVVVGLVYPFALAIKNGLSGYVSPGMFVAKPIDPQTAPTEYGTLLEFGETSTEDRWYSGLRSSLAWRGLDLDALRMYLRWRGVTLEEIRADPDRYRDPGSLPASPGQPGDGSIATDGGVPDDPWGAETFLADIDGDAYGTTPADLRAGLDTLSTADIVWISPGIPFLVPLFGGLLVSLTYGDLVFGLLGLFGVG